MTGPTMKTTCYLILTLMATPLLPAQGGGAGQPSEKEIQRIVRAQETAIRRVSELKRRVENLRKRMEREGRQRSADLLKAAVKQLDSIDLAEQMSEITGDESTKGNIKIRLSIPQCKAAFMDSQNAEQLGVGQAAEGSEQTVLDFDEWLECLARIATTKYSAIKQMDPSQKVKAFMQNFFVIAGPKEDPAGIRG